MWLLIFQNSVQLLFCAPALHPETEMPSQSRNSWMEAVSTLERVQGRFSWNTGRMFQVQPPPPPAGTVGMLRHILEKSHISITHVTSNYSCGLSALLETQVMNTASPSAATLSERVSVLRHAWMDKVDLFNPGNTNVDSSPVLLLYLRRLPGLYFKR